jgi:hypothetical protein
MNANSCLVLYSQEKASLLKDQQELIKVLNEERKDNERRFHQMTVEDKIVEKAPLPVEIVKEEHPPSRSPAPKGRIFIKEESPERIEEEPTNEDRPPIPGRSVTDNVTEKVRGRVRNPFRNREKERDDPSLLDMAAFLRSTGPDTPRTSDEAYRLPLKPKRSRSKYEARDPIVRNDTADMINFFRDSSPQLTRNSTVKTARSITPVRAGTVKSVHSTTPSRHAPAADPMTPPLTGKEETEREKVASLPPQPVSPPPMSHLRSQSAGLPSPLGSHPPIPIIDMSRPATTKWPLQAVLAWLEKNAFSPEWQETFRVLEIQGSDFVELESGQSIRKMLTVIYPHLAKECSESGRGWDQATERAEGQRLRKLIRELPVEIKYEDGSHPQPSTEVNGTALQDADQEDTIVGIRRRAVTAPAENTATSSITSTPQRPTTIQARNEFMRTEVLPPPEEDEEQERPKKEVRLQLKKVSDDPSRDRSESGAMSVHDEWLKKWTVLSPEEIARGQRQVQRAGVGHTMWID